MPTHEVGHGTQRFADSIRVWIIINFNDLTWTTYGEAPYLAPLERLQDQHGNRVLRIDGSWPLLVVARGRLPFPSDSFE